MEKLKIGMFDSGIGGATVLKECIKLCPEFDFIYYSDSKNNPYGDKSKDEIVKISSKIVENLISEGCKIIVIACNTASAMAVNELRANFSIPIIAIEPAIKLAYDKKGATLVMATKGTLDSEKFHNLYEKYHNSDTYLLQCVGLANLIENGDDEKIEKYLVEHLQDFQNVKNVVLGCTHYPLIEDKIKNVLGDVNIFHGAEGVAKQLKKVADENEFEYEENSIGNIKFFDSSLSKEKAERFYKFLNEN